MLLFDAKINSRYVIKSINITDSKTKLRIMELGLITGTSVIVKRKSMLKHTFLIVFSSACFTLKDNLAKQIEVENA